MRLLHTSDWHLGRTLHGADLRAAHEAFVDHLVATAREEAVDAVVVAGDVYDRAVPPLDAVRLLDDALARLADTGAQVVVISGNHDSSQRLGFGAALFARGGVHVRTDVASCGRPVLLQDAHGEVACYPLPYLDPDLSRPALAAGAAGEELPARSHAAVLGRGMARVRADLATRPGVRSVVVAHAWVTGAGGAASQASESERDIAVGGVSHVGASLFDGVDYVALGHLHRPQAVTESVRYAGSPLAFSFGEADQAKGSLLVEFGAQGVLRVDTVPAPVPRRLAQVRGELEELLVDPRCAELEQAWLRVTLTDARRPLDAMARLQARFPHALVLRHEPPDLGVAGEASRRSLQRLGDREVVDAFARHVRGVPLDGPEGDLVEQGLAAVLEASRGAGAGGVQEQPAAVSA